jgi:hypothetical protein
MKVDPLELKNPITKASITAALAGYPDSAQLRFDPNTFVDSAIKLTVSYMAKEPQLIDLCGQVLNDHTISFALRFMDPNCSREFFRLRMHTDDALLYPQQLSGLKIERDNGVPAGEVFLDDKEQVPVVRIKNIGRLNYVQPSC